MSVPFFARQKFSYLASNHMDSSSTLGNQERIVQIYEYFCTEEHGPWHVYPYKLAPGEKDDRRKLFW
jgi:hypothetical protein